MMRVLERSDQHEAAFCWDCLSQDFAKAAENSSALSTKPEGGSIRAAQPEMETWRWKYEIASPAPRLFAC